MLGRTTIETDPFTQPRDLAPAQSEVAESRRETLTGSRETETRFNRDKRRKKPEVPTWFLIATIYGGFAALLTFHAVIPLWLAIPMGIVLVGWHASLQHECLHGHPSGIALIDDAIAFPPLALWLPYCLYKESHLEHHKNPQLTDPYDDPESFYVSEEDWQRKGPVGRVFRHILNTLAGRLLLGPAWSALRLWAEVGGKALKGDPVERRRLAVHIVAVSCVLWLAVGIAGVPFWLYAIWAYFGTSLLLLRSFAEHRAAQKPGNRIAVTETGPFFALLFLNNALHAVHHHRPGLAWYRLPEAYRADRDRYLRENGNYLIPGYKSLLRFLVQPKEHPALPNGWGTVSRKTADRP